MTVTCSQCGTTRVQIMDWIDPNRDDKLLGGNDTPSCSECYCARCEENVRLDWDTEDVRANARDLRQAGDVPCPFGCGRLHVAYNQANECRCSP